MCHGYDRRVENRYTEHHDDETPEFLNEESDNHEVLTDGGDEE